VSAVRRRGAPGGRAGASDGAAGDGDDQDGGRPVASGARVTRILLASEGRAISGAALQRTIELARDPGASVHVLSIARVHGAAFGLPNPGLLPTKSEWDEQRELVRKAVARLRRRGVDADGHVVGTRNASKRIVQEAERRQCDAIVMAGDPDRSRIVANVMWSQEPQRVRRRAKIPVFIVPAGD
jgi:nucleotide-binding universal stress UspA family protein